MAAITKRLLHLRPNFHSHVRLRPFPHHHFSSSSGPDIPQPEPGREPDSDTETRPSFSSNFNEVKASLQREPPPQNRHQTPGKTISFSGRPQPETRPPSGADSTEEIRRHLSEFRIRSAAPPPPPPPPSSGGQYISLQELYERNVISKGEGSANSSGSSAGGRRSLESIRESLRQLNSAAPSAGNRNDSGGITSDRWSLARFTENLKLKAGANANQGGNESFIPSFLRKETRGKGDGNIGSTGFRRMEFGRTYDRADLGKKLKTLRPENRKGKWFSLQELSDRLAKLKEAEEKEMNTIYGGVFKDIRHSIKIVQQATEEKTQAQRRPLQNIGILGSLGGTPSYELKPPKDQLVEKYFHPDNMSSAEKLKLELKNVRDEFKMSESDCGSARVQVAQLTTKIKHLSIVLHKKDKHSRRGLQAMVQRRKKLLKYLRRTDWDSYCFVLSKLGVRDNPDIKA